jgi:glycosyltransferase involved in cell wall biosynthesis
MRREGTAEHRSDLPQWAAVPPANYDVTVVIANHNYGRFLVEAVDSLRAQEGGAPHVVVVDDGSTEPETLAALDDLPEGVEVVRQANQGVSAARNAGLARVSTPYWLVLDADDRLAPGALSALRAPLERDERPGYAFGFMRFFGAMSGIVRFPDFDPYRLLYRHTIGLTALARTAVLDATGGYDLAFSHYEDWELWVHALALGFEGVRVDAVTLEYRRHDGTKFASDRRNYRVAWRALRRKHAALYARRGELAARSALGPAGRAAYRWFWGPRPVPAALVAAVHRRLWRSAAL